MCYHTKGIIPNCLPRVERSELRFPVLVNVYADQRATFAGCHSVTIPYRVCDSDPVCGQAYLLGPGVGVHPARVLAQAAEFSRWRRLHLFKAVSFV
jgi:hypothetical protein